MALNFQNEQKSALSGFYPVVLLVCAVVLFGVFCFEGAGGPLHAIQGVFQSMTTPFKAAGGAVGTGIENAATAISDGTADESSLSSLRKQNEQLRQRVAELEEASIEAKRLQSLLNIKQSSGVEGVSASVIGKSGEAYSQTITISAGSNQGVDVGQTVMGGSGVIGQVISVTPTTSVVRLLTDPKSGAAVLVQSSRAEGIVRGSLDGLLYLEDLDSETVISVGDVLLTSGQGGSYISGLIVGQVARIDNAQDPGSRRVVVAPNDSGSQLQNVIVVSSVSQVQKVESSSNSSNGESGQSSGNTLISSSSGGGYDAA